MSITVEQFEDEFYGGTISASRAVDVISRMCAQLRQQGYLKNQQHPDTRIYTRLAAAIGHWLINKKEALNERDYHQLLNDFPTIISIFALSGFANADHVLGFLLAQDEENLDFAAILLCLHPGSTVELEMPALWSISPQLTLAWYVRALSLEFYIPKEADDFRERLLTASGIIRGSKLDQRSLPAALLAWMHCSYASLQEKHELKHNLNRLFKRLLGDDRTAESLIQQESSKRRPKLLVLAEMFSASHAMFRCYLDWIKQLGRDFDVEVLIESTQIDQPAIDQLECVQTFEHGVKFDELAEIVRGKKPAVIFYPSVGMMLWTVLLSNLRLAPIQLASIGHPATTRSDAIDYMIMIDGVAKDPRCYSEKVITVENMLLTYPAAIPKNKVRIRKGKDMIRVAIASRAFKLNYDFLSTLRRIADRSGKHIEYHFFAGHTGILHQHLAHNIGSIVRNAVVHPARDYPSYMKALFRCELHLESFPFGGTNSNIDSLMLGIPIVCMEGREPHSSIDAVIMRKIGMPEWLICRKSEQYENAALRMINNDDERERTSKLIRTSALDTFLVSPEEQVRNYEFADTISWLYRNHSWIKQSNQQVWRPDDRPELAGK